MASITQSGVTLLSTGSQNMVRQATARNHYLSADEERELVLAWRERRDNRARERILLSHLPLALKLSRKQSGYGLDLDDILGAAQIGLIKGLDNFDPDRGARFATCAFWSITEEINNYVMRSTSLLRGPNTAAARSLFFGLRRAKATLGLSRVATLEEAAKVRDLLAEKTATSADMELSAIVEADAFMSMTALALDAPIGAGDDSDGYSLGNILADGAPGADERLAEREKTAQHRTLLKKAVANVLTEERDRTIFVNRKLAEPPKTLEELAVVYHVSRERIRQLENRAMDRVTREVKRLQHAAEDEAALQRSAWSRRVEPGKSHAEAPAYTYVQPRSRMAAPIRQETGGAIVIPAAAPVPSEAPPGFQDAAALRSEATRRGNETRGAQRRHEISLKAAATMRARRQAAQDDDGLGLRPDPAAHWEPDARMAA